MAEEQDSGRGFRVQDRRRFSPDTGEPRVSETEEKESRQSATVDRQASPHTDAHQGQAQQSEKLPPELSFSSFILGLSTQALMYMGEIASPGQTATTNLSAAQEMIDIITMLQHKTTGNLDRGESEMLDTVLFDLRMRYVELANTRHS
jgi:hypothetical protein